MMERTSDLHVTEQRTLNELINSKRMGGWKRLRKTLELAALLQAESGRGFIGFADAAGCTRYDSHFSFE